MVARKKDKKVGATKAVSKKELEDEMEEIEEEVEEVAVGERASIKASKAISAIKKGDKIVVDNMTLEVDAHYILIDHGTTKEMAIEIFDPKTDKDYQLRYFADQVESTLELYELADIMYVKKPFSKVEW
jgi:hypothetical protein